MRRSSMPPRADWQRRCEDVGFSFHSLGGRYWEETACYVLSSEEVDILEAAAEELQRLCLEACEHIVRTGRYGELAIPGPFSECVGDSWKRRDPSIFGRFDLAWDGKGQPKLLEYNADTPTALIEASVAQWFWLEDRKRLESTASGAIDESADQFNSLHEKLIERWRNMNGALGPKTLYFACVRDHEEDYGKTHSLRDTAIQGGSPRNSYSSRTSAGAQTPPASSTWKETPSRRCSSSIQGNGWHGRDSALTSCR